MRKIHTVLGLAAMLSIQPVFADDGDMTTDGAPCATVAKTCLEAGYVRNNDGPRDKMFWQDCMKPVLLGQAVKDVNIDAKTVKGCRMNKIEQLKNELKEFEKASK